MADAVISLTRPEVAVESWVTRQAFPLASRGLVGAVGAEHGCGRTHLTEVARPALQTQGRLRFLAARAVVARRTLAHRSCQPSACNTKHRIFTMFNVDSAKKFSSNFFSTNTVGSYREVAQHGDDKICLEIN